VSCLRARAFDLDFWPYARLMMSSSISSIAAAARRAVAALRRTGGAAVVVTRDVARKVASAAAPVTARVASRVAAEVTAAAKAAEPVALRFTASTRAALTRAVNRISVSVVEPVRSFFAVRTLPDALRRAGGVAAAAAAAVLATYASVAGGLLVDEGRPIADAIPPLPAVSRTAPTPERELKPLGRFRMTFYYVVNEEDVPEPPVVVAAADAAPPPTDIAAPTPGSEIAADATAPVALAAATASDGGVTLASTGPEMVPVYDKRCRELATVTRRFLAQMRMQGTGKLRDGRTLNIWGECECPRTPCYREVEGVRWGYAGNGRALSPFRTVAVDPRKIKLGSLLYVAELDGRTMPGRAPWGGFVHDGCVVADDTGGGVKGHQLDLFVGRRAFYKALGRRGGSHAWARKVAVYDGSTRCQRTGGKVSASQRGAI
jgi:3D (Asp-Asp-Asp) domain-containing protein